MRVPYNLDKQKAFEKGIVQEQGLRTQPLCFVLPTSAKHTLCFGEYIGGNVSGSDKGAPRLQIVTT